MIVYENHRPERSLFLCGYYVRGRQAPRQAIIAEVTIMRVRITLACTECKQRNYNVTKEKKNHPDRLETKKYCPFCKAHTLHKETK